MRRGSGHRYVALVYCTAYPPGCGPPGAEHSHDNDGFVFLDVDQPPPRGQICGMVAVFEIRGEVEVVGPHLTLESEAPISALVGLERGDTGPSRRYAACAGLHYCPDLPPAPNSVFAVAGTEAGEALGFRLIRRFDPPVPMRRTVSPFV